MGHNHILPMAFKSSIQIKFMTAPTKCYHLIVFHKSYIKYIYLS